MVELAVADTAAARSWYEQKLGLRAVLTDPATDFVLLADGRSGKLALRSGGANPGSVALHFEVPDVDAALRESGLVAEGPVVTSPEGYREAFVRDPDGYRVGLFDWVK